MDFTMEAETERLVDLLKLCLRVLGITNREVARRMGLSPSYVSKLFSGTSEMRVDYFLRVLKAAGLEPAEFFSLAYPRQPSRGSAAAMKLRELLQSFQPPPPPQKPAEAIDEAKLEEMFKATLERMILKSGEGG